MLTWRHKCSLYLETYFYLLLRLNLMFTLLTFPTRAINSKKESTILLFSLTCNRIAKLELTY